MNRLDGILEAAELKPCPFCKRDVQLEDCSEKDLGWGGFRIICRRCRLQMFSEPLKVYSFNFATRELHMVRSEVAADEIAARLAARWNHRGSYT